MTDPENETPERDEAPQEGEVPAPFDDVPRPAEESSPAEARLPRPALAAIAGLIGLSGLGIGLSVALWFGGARPHLRPEPATTPEAEPERVEAPSASKADEDFVPSHVLELGRRAFERGDLEAARWIASSFLLRLDGLSPLEQEREPEALTLLADVLRRDYEASLPRGKER